MRIIRKRIMVLGSGICLIAAGAIFFLSCEKSGSGAIKPDASAVQVKINLGKTYQTIEGFGFFGAKSVWWQSYNTAQVFTNAWAEKVINDLGITMWRNEIYPQNPVSGTEATNSQDSNWKLQKPVVQGLFNKAKELGVDLKIILTMWSPPGEFKTNNSTINWDDKAFNGDIGGGKGGTLKPDSFSDYANWLISALDLYREIGIEVYALSLQNEPGFDEPYNSCTYTPESYVTMMKGVVPLVKAKYPNLKIFGSEHMLEHEVNKWNDFALKIRDDNEALKLLDAFAVHGYADGIEATDIGKHRHLWETYYNWFGNRGKPIWMTETSGYSNKWIGEPGSPASFDYGLAIASALKYGQASAWVHWQGSENKGAGKLPDNGFVNGNGLITGKQYAAAQQFYRFIRPGAKMVEVTCEDPSLLVVAFIHAEEERFTSVIINTSMQDKIVWLDGVNVPAVFDFYETNADSNFILTENVINGQFTVKAQSIATVVK